MHVHFTVLKTLIFLDLVTLFYIPSKSLYKFFMLIFIFYDNDRFKKKF